MSSNQLKNEHVSQIVDLLLHSRPMALQKNILTTTTTTKTPILLLKIHNYVYRNDLRSLRFLKSHNLLSNNKQYPNKFLLGGQRLCIPSGISSAYFSLGRPLNFSLLGFHSLELTSLNARAWTDFILRPLFYRWGNWGSRTHYLPCTTTHSSEAGHYIFISWR